MKLTRRNFSLIVPAAALAQTSLAMAQKPGHSRDPLFVNLDQVKWMLDDPANPNSPAIAILRVDSVTEATQLLIRNAPGEYIPLHWH